MPKRTELMALVVRLKDVYLKSPDSHGGGGAQEYYGDVRAWAAAHPMELKKFALDGLLKAAGIAWHSKTGTQEDYDDEDVEADHASRQLTIGGLDLPRELVYYAPEGGKTKDEAYLHVYVENGATVGHLEMDLQVFIDNLERQKDKRKTKAKLLNVALQRSGGNRATLLIDIIDDDAKAA